MIVSIEKVTISLADTVGSGSANLTKGQTPANCLPLLSMESDPVSFKWDTYRATGITFVSGSPATCVATRFDTRYALNLTVYVVEFDAAEVAVQHVTYATTYGGLTSVNSISTVDPLKAFAVMTPSRCENVADRNWLSPSWTGTDNELTLTRNTGTGIQEGEAYIAEYIGSGAGFTVQVVSRLYRGQVTLGATIDPDKTFVISYGLTAAQANGAHPRTWLEDGDTVEMDALDASTGGTILAQVVTFGASSTGSVQRGVFSFASTDVEETATLAAVDLDYATAHHPQMLEGGNNPSSTYEGRLVCMMDVSSTTQITGSLLDSRATACEHDWEVIVWPSPAPVGPAMGPLDVGGML